MVQSLFKCSLLYRFRVYCRFLMLRNMSLTFVLCLSQYDLTRSSILYGFLVKI